ncbi:gliding motility lipoprotein GldH [Persicobacter diffluens]|uniref:Gliding motility lipoprotein GldH n=1 Tax=Persicobacter diffluens TaxID=981 RepID=A0AAN4VW39_9BACT|nr:hypothetical protein PEDI_04320 [Persicobacter diffluens]
MKRLKFCLLACMALAFFACDSGQVYEAMHKFEGQKWEDEDAPKFDFSIPDPGQEYNVACLIRNTLQYPKHNIYLTYTLEDSTGQVLDSQLLKKDLFDPVTGRPLGTGIGDIFDHEFMLKEHFKFPQRGGYRLKLQQFVRNEETSLPEIVAVGIRVSKSN